MLYLPIPAVLVLPELIKLFVFVRLAWLMKARGDYTFELRILSFKMS
jgi:hypothetical protein